MPGIIFILVFCYLVISWLLTPVACICPECREDVNAKASACPTCHRSIKPKQKWWSWFIKNMARLGVIMLVIYLLNPENRTVMVTEILKLVFGVNK